MEGRLPPMAYTINFGMRGAANWEAQPLLRLCFLGEGAHQWGRCHDMVAEWWWSGTTPPLLKTGAPPVKSAEWSDRLLTLKF